MKAMIFAAGLGSRLHPLTDTKPKALVEVAGKPLLLHAIKYLEQFGITDFVINAHHFSNQIISYCNNLPNHLNIQISDESNELLDTGGGLKKTGKWLSMSSEPIVVLNADILTNLDISKMYEFHIENHNMVTMAVRDRASSRKLVFNNDFELVGWRNLKSGEVKDVKTFDQSVRDYAFSGIHIVSPRVFDFFPSEKAFSIIDFYLNLAKEKKIVAFIDNENYWFDVGTIEKLNIAEEFFKSKASK